MEQANKQKLPGFAEVKAAAESAGWLSIYKALCSDFGEAVAKADGRKTPLAVQCPFCNNAGHKSFRFFGHVDQTGRGICNQCGPKTDPFENIAAINRLASAFDAMKAVRDHLGMTSFSEVKANPNPKPKVNYQDRENTPEKIERRRARLYAILAECVPLNHGSALPAQTYFERRGISTKYWSSVEVQFHPALDYFDVEGQQVTGKYPCIVSQVKKNDGTLVALHRTYIDHFGNKAAVKNTKMMTKAIKDGDVNGCAIHLTPLGGDRLAVTEGLETGVAVGLATGNPVWVYISATLLGDADIPDQINTLDIWGDNDRSQVNRETGEETMGAGQKYALQLFQRRAAAGKHANIFIPGGKVPDGQKSVDWLDVFNDIHALDMPQSMRVAVFKRASGW